MQYLIDIIVEVLRTIIGFFFRGDIAAFDWTVVDFTADNAWHDLDLSGIVPAGTRCVMFRLDLRDNLVGRTFWLRRDGNVNVHNASGIVTQVANVYNRIQLVCPCSINRMVEYKVPVGGIDIINLVVVGWWQR